MASVASGSMDEPLPNRSTTLGLSGRELGVLGPFKTSREPFLLPLPPNLRGQRKSGRRLGLDAGLGLGLGLTDGQEVSGSELAEALLLFRSLSPRPCRLGFRNVSGEEGALRTNTALGSEMAMDIEAVAEVWTKILVACFFLCFDLSFLSFLLGITGSEATYTMGVSPTGEMSLLSAMVFIRSGS